MNKILINVKGGIVQSVGCTEDCEIAIVDWDNIEGGETNEIAFEKETASGEIYLTEQVKIANDYIKENQSNESN
jgi:hypothetical protein